MITNRTPLLPPVKDPITISLTTSGVRTKQHLLPLLQTHPLEGRTLKLGLGGGCLHCTLLPLAMDYAVRPCRCGQASMHACAHARSSCRPAGLFAVRVSRSLCLSLRGRVRRRGRYPGRRIARHSSAAGPCERGDCRRCIACLPVSWPWAVATAGRPDVDRGRMVPECAGTY